MFKLRILLFLLYVTTIVFVMAAKIDANSVGVCYGQCGHNLPSNQDVINLYKNNGITRMRIYDPNPNVFRALEGTNIELILDIPNCDLESLTDQNAATVWVQTNILTYPTVKFKYISVGNEINPNKETARFAKFVLPTMQTVHKAIRDAGLQIKVSTATYTGLLKTSYPPRHGEFDDEVVGFIKLIIKFLVENKSPMLANIYPYFAYIGTPCIDLAYALFTAQRTVVSDGHDRQYSNLFYAMYDAHFAAQARLGGASVPIVVSESGWPSAGHQAATVNNAGTYYRNLINHVKMSNGTPARRGISIETYLFAMFDENMKPGKETEKHFGVFSPNQQSKYQLKFN
ncbi:glucan endo-1,3-beta-glucosidase-like [Rutidosis leptorrhynchoides]|uniref:glucan endo-1,3-beta-glucosidase-like n=1 Tax=Rutidosis leptorrhynchoides TaxID=125765 RepID=UPI003A99A509